MWAKMKRRERWRVSYTFSQVIVIIQGTIPKIPYLKSEQGVAYGFVQTTGAQFSQRCVIPPSLVRRRGLKHRPIDGSTFNGGLCRRGSGIIDDGHDPMQKVCGTRPKREPHNSNKTPSGLGIINLGANNRTTQQSCAVP